MTKSWVVSTSANSLSSEHAPPRHRELGPVRHAVDVGLDVLEPEGVERVPVPAVDLAVLGADGEGPLRGVHGRGRAGREHRPVVDPGLARWQPRVVVARPPGEASGDERHAHSVAMAGRWRLRLSWIDHGRGALLRGGRRGGRPARGDLDARPTVGELRSALVARYGDAMARVLRPARSWSTGSCRAIPSARSARASTCCRRSPAASRALSEPDPLRRAVGEVLALPDRDCAP